MWEGIGVGLTVAALNGLFSFSSSRVALWRKEMCVESISPSIP